MLRLSFFALVVLLLTLQMGHSSPQDTAIAAQFALATLTPGTRTPPPTVTGWPTATPTATQAPPPTVTSWITTTPNRTPVPTVTGWPTQTSTPTQIPGATPTSTPTSGPVPSPINPSDGALMPQPVSGGWYFRWAIPDIPNCRNGITISGPGGRQITATITTAIGGSGTTYEYHYLTHDDLPDDALGPWTWSVTAFCHSIRSSETRTFWVQRSLATVTPSPTRPVITATPYPQPAELLAPPEGALMRQPVAPGEWYFAWEAESGSASGDCFSRIHLMGPNGQEITERVDPNSSTSLLYEYQYLTNAPLSGSDLGPWQWEVQVICPLGESLSPRRTFWVQAPVYELYLPLLANREGGANFGE
ncbi:MAG: hypothetical protein H0T73_00845 [Ardenticatenales bacterium]|nr:hypothetical protein [Ardenticatenales bacterium]